MLEPDDKLHTDLGESDTSSKTGVPGPEDGESESMATIVVRDLKDQPLPECHATDPHSIVVTEDTEDIIDAVDDSSTFVGTVVTMLTHKLPRGHTVLPQWKDPLDPSLATRHFYPEAIYPLDFDDDDVEPDCDAPKTLLDLIDAPNKTEGKMGDGGYDDNGGCRSPATAATMVVHAE